MAEPDISEYALIGNCRAAALVSRFGSIDWCCLPEFDSPSIFAALLDKNKGGHFSIFPAELFTSKQKYLEDSNVVETSFSTERGQIHVIDGFTVVVEDDKMHSLYPDHEILRVVEGVSGVVRMRMEYVPRPVYGNRIPTLKDYRKLGINFACRETSFCLLCTLDPSLMRVSEAGRVIAEFDVPAGERIIFSLSCCSQSPAILPELFKTGQHRMASTVNFWRKWVHKCKYGGLYASEVRRSLLVLKLLTHAPSGAIIAAPTTSLPEKIGGKRNWDYRYCWLRDASFTTRVLLKLGFEEEVRAYMNWIIHATALTRPRLQVVYSVYGHAKLKEKTLSWLAGYRNSLPVNIGNNADDQFQLDVYGEVLDAIYIYSVLVPEFDQQTKKFIIGLGKVICRSWNEPDNGIWEIRATKIHHTHSKVMCWVGLDRLLKLCAKYAWEDAPIESFRETADSIYHSVSNSGYNEQLKSYTRQLGGDELDASVLTFSLVGFDDYRSERMRSTTETIARDLSSGNLIYRYRGIDDGVGGSEGCFGICNFWLAENLARSGSVQSAIRLVDKVLECAGPTGLLSEEIDPVTEKLLGNYPQAFTHIGLVNAVLAIDEELKKGGVSLKRERVPR